MYLKSKCHDGQELGTEVIPSNAINNNPSDKSVQGSSMSEGNDCAIESVQSCDPTVSGPATTTSVKNIVQRSTDQTTLLVTLDEPSRNDVGKWCVVLYDHKPYPGVIVDVDDSDWGIEVKVMHRIGVNRFFWPMREDRCWYICEQFVTLINEPASVGTRHVQIDRATWNIIAEKFGE